MVDYKEMYLEMVRETERAINILIQVQCRCEEMYISSSEPEITLLTPPISEIPPNTLP